MASSIHQTALERLAPQPADVVPWNDDAKYVLTGMVLSRVFPPPTISQKQELAASLIRLVGVLLDSPDGFASDMTKVLECIFVKALVWSVGSCVDSKGRQLFGSYLRMVMEDKGLEESEAHQDFLLKNRSWVARDRPIASLPPDDGRLLYDFRFDAKKGQWLPWLETVSY